MPSFLNIICLETI